MGLIKDIYSLSFYEHLASIMKKAHASLQEKDFVQQVMTTDFQVMEWKERMKHTTQVVHRFLPENYVEAISVLVDTIAELKNEGFSGGLTYMIFPDYIETYGLEDFKTSVTAFESITPFISCEFAVRPFIIRYGADMLTEMVKWSQHENAQVRRLASEGSRPRLPWAMAIPALKKDPTPILPILENLKNDPSETVRRSVANSLNDISKDHPDILLDIAKKWMGFSKESDALVKHAGRTLLKQGHPQILSLYGLDLEGLKFADFQIHTPLFRMGDALTFSFKLHNTGNKSKKVRLEYGIYYKKANGNLSKKVFKISEKILEKEQQIKVERRHSFRPITTRKYYSGIHRLAVIINGVEQDTMEFMLNTEDK